MRDAAGREAPTGTPQQRAVLAMLAMRAGELVTSTDLLDGIFGDEHPRTAAATISTYVGRLRRVLGRGILASVPGGYQLDVAPEHVDVNRFADLTAAAAQAPPADALDLYREAESLWRGEALAGSGGPYAERQRAALTERRLTAWEARLRLELDLGRHASIAAELQGTETLHPFRERLHAIHMLALYRLDRQGEALTIYEQVRKTLAGELGVDPGPELAELHTAILRADPALHVVQPIPVAGAHPAQLPADVGDFIGRAEVLAGITVRLSGAGQSGCTLVAISGMGGVGKTTLAIRAAHAVRPLFPDGQLYADMQEAPPAEVLGRFIVALGWPPDALPATESERAALYRSLTADKRLLVLLDNVADQAQVGCLVPGSPSCATLVTSRPMLAHLPSARHVVLDVMSEQEALELLTAVVGEARVAAEPEGARRLVAACGLLPLAIRLAAGRLLARPNWLLAHLVGRLGGLEELRASFDRSYAQLSDREGAALLALASGDEDELTLAACAQALRLAEEEAEEILESLVDRAVLSSPAPCVYRFQNLARQFISEYGEPERVRAASRGRKTPAVRIRSRA
ncbi:BTAD domain-containing putative transcriptional regulator [Nonomuraea typhae]|uniref:BTAD domain-containing putative transcriptional regulator n=1 Tax=Nonomuraea typhae TaxID=2603600 RepID=A0ABW7YVC9_9ACTN